MKKVAAFDKEAFKKEVEKNLKTLYRKSLDEATPQMLFQAVSYAVKDDIIERWIATHKVYKEQKVKKVYYLSMEFLMGRALGNNLLNLGYYPEIKEALEEMGLDINFIEDVNAYVSTTTSVGGITRSPGFERGVYDLQGRPAHAAQKGFQVRSGRVVISQ